MKRLDDSHFYKLSLKKKIEFIKKFSELNREDLEILKSYQKLPDFFDIENNIGPFKIATNFFVEGKEYLVPMETEEPSVVAAASRGAKLIKEGGGFRGRYLGNQMIGQIQLLGVRDFRKSKKKILENKKKILNAANQTNRFLLRIGGGANDIAVKKRGRFLVLYLFVDTKDAMGANIINTMVERISPLLAEYTHATVGLRIISNFAPKRIVSVWARVSINSLELNGFPGEKVAEGILSAQKLAELDIYRAVTHNKGVMNGIDAVALATGNDTRAIEAAVHSFAARRGKYQPIARWKREKEYLRGEIKTPLPIATVGGATSTKKAKLALKILGVKNAQELGIVAGAVGLANNLAALSVLATEGIQRGHMKIHREFVKKTGQRRSGQS